MASHGAMKHPTVVEVLLEVRFESQITYSEFKKRFDTQIQDLFQISKAEKIAAGVEVVIDAKTGEAKVATVGGDPPPGEILEIRYTNLESGLIIQVGNGIAAINHLKYDGFLGFSNDVSNFLRVLIESAGLRGFSRLALQFINQLPFNDEWWPALSWIAPLPPINWKDTGIKLASNVQQVLLELPENNILRVAVAYPRISQSKESVIHMDIEVFADLQPLAQPNIVEILGWVDRAHNESWDAYVHLLTPEVFARRKTGEQNE